MKISAAMWSTSQIAQNHYSLGQGQLISIEPGDNLECGNWRFRSFQIHLSKSPKPPDAQRKTMEH